MAQEDKADVRHKHTTSDIRGGRFPEGMLPSTIIPSIEAAQATATSKSKVVFSADAASGTAFSESDVWYQRAAGIIIAQWEFTSGAWAARTLRPATDTQTGISEFATDAETITGTDDTRATTPAGVKAALENDTSAWTAVTFASGYMDYAAGYECEVRKIGKVVYARGLFKPTTGTFAAAAVISPVLTVPVGFRPIDQPSLFFPAFAGSAGMYTAGLLLAPTGVMTARTAPISTPAYISLSGLSWVVD